MSLYAVAGSNGFPSRLRLAFLYTASGCTWCVSLPKNETCTSFFRIAPAVCGFYRCLKSIDGTGCRFSEQHVFRGESLPLVRREKGCAGARHVREKAGRRGLLRNTSRKFRRFFVYIQVEASCILHPAERSCMNG